MRQPRVSTYRFGKFESGDGKFNGLIWSVEAYGDRGEKAIVEFDQSGNVSEVKEVR